MKVLSPSVFFNQLPLKNDLAGELQGSVLLAQSSILPSRASVLSGDIQPHLVSQRDTLVLFKPINADIDSSSGIVLKIYTAPARVIYAASLSSPDLLPELTGQIDVSEAEFIEPDRYDHTINRQNEFNSMRNDTGGNYLSGILNNNKNVKINTSDGNFIADIYLPNAVAAQAGRLITYVRNAAYESHLHYSGKTVTPARGATTYFKNVGGVWVTLADVPYYERAQVFAELGGSYDVTVSTRSDVEKASNDAQASFFRSLFSRNNTIDVRTADGVWGAAFYLPENDQALDGKRISFHSNAGYNSQIFYSGVSSVLSRGKVLTFVNKDGAWAEWNDSQYSKISYGRNFWSCTIPWKYISPGVNFEISATNMQGSKIYGYHMELGARGAGELFINTIDIGMLTPNRDETRFKTMKSITGNIFSRYRPAALS